MMLCDDISSNLPSAHNQSKCPMDGLQLGLKTGEIHESSAPSEQIPVMFKSNDCLKSIPTSNDQCNWGTNHSEQITRHVEFAAGNQCQDAEKQNADSEMNETGFPESRHSKRIADYADLQHPSYSFTKKLKLDEHLVNNDPVQEHWKKGALGYRPREVVVDASECGVRELAVCSKDDLSHRVNRIETTILHNEMALVKLRSTLENLEESVARSDKCGGKTENEVEGSGEELKPQLSCLEQVLMENRRKAEASHAFLDKMKSTTGSALYQQPHDTVVFHENKQKFLIFKKRLVAHLKKKDETRQLQAEKLNEQWNRIYEAWKKKMETIESSQKQRSKKLRDYFDKIFPEMQKQEEEKIKRYCSSALKSDNANEQKGHANEDCDKISVETELMEKFRSLAAQPPPLLDLRGRRFGFRNENGFIEDPEQINSISTLKCSFWTEHEREIFTEKYIRHPKKFGLIASLLENKSVQDCVQFYYLTKKEVGYKKLQRPKYTRKVKIRATANNLKEDKAESKNATIEPSNKAQLPSDNEPLVLFEQKNTSEFGLSKEPAPEERLPKPNTNRRPSLLERPISRTPSVSSETSLTRTDCSSDKLKIRDGSTPVSDLKIHDLGDTLDAQPTESDGKMDEIHVLSDSSKAAADDDNESVATLSADEASGPCPYDDNLTEKTRCRPVPNVDSRRSSLGIKIKVATSVLSDEIQRSQKHLPASLNLDDNQHLSSNQDDRRRHDRVPTVSPLLALNPRSECQRLIRSSGDDVVDRVRSMPELLPLTTSAQGCSQQTYSQSVGDRCIDGRVAARVSGLSSFTRNTGSPTRIRDLIHAAIEKNLQAIDGKPDLISSKNDSKKFRPSNNLNYKPPLTSALVAENTEVQDLSMRASRVSSASKTSIGTSAKFLPPQPNLYQFPKGGDSPYYPRPAHTNHPDTRAGSLLDLANAAEYEHLRRIEQQKAMIERDNNSFRRFDASSSGESYILNAAGQTWRQREESVHKGSIMQGTPISTAPHNRNHMTHQSSDVCIDGLGIHPSAVGHNVEFPSESVSWHRSAYSQVVPQISEHNKLLRNDFLTAQQLRSMQGSSLRADGREQWHHSSHLAQDVPSRSSLASHYDTRVADVYQPSKAAQPAQTFPNTNAFYQQRMPARQFPDEITVARGQKAFHDSRTGGSQKVMSTCRSSPLEVDRGERLPALVQPDRNSVASVKSFPVLSCKPDQLVWQNAAQLIEDIINNQISKPDGDDKIHSSSILRQLDEISPVPYDDSVFAHVPISFQSNCNRNEQVMPNASSKSAIPDRTAEFSGRASEKLSIANAGARERSLFSDSQALRRDVGLLPSEKGFDSSIQARENLQSLSSGMRQSDIPFPVSVANVNSEAMDSCNRQMRRPMTIGESLDAIVEDVTRHGSQQIPIDRNQFAMKNFVAGSVSIQQTSSLQRDFGPENRRNSLSHSSSPKPASMTNSNNSRMNTDEVKSREEARSASSEGGSSSRPFSWKTKLLREHQKQQVENEDSNQTLQKPIQIECRANDHRPSSTDKLSLNDKEESSVVHSDAVNFPTSRIPSPSDARSVGSSAVHSVGEDHPSTIAASHQMMSTLLSNRSGHQPGLVLPSSVGIGPILSSTPPLNSTAGEESALIEATVPEQCEEQARSPAATGPASPGSDSQGSDRSGRLVIRMDSFED